MAGTTSSYDVIVTGVGSMGAAACYFLAHRGHRVLGVDQFDIPHENGSHAGQSRIIRAAYFEHPDYVPLLKRAYYHWRNFEEETGEQLYYPTGLVYYGLPGNAVIEGVKQSARIHSITVQPGADSANNKVFTIPRDHEVLFEPDAGFVRPEKTVELYNRFAEKYGAEIHTKEKVLAWKALGNGVSVTTNRASYHCKKLILSPGAWAARLAPELKDRLKVTRQVIAWIKPKRPEQFTHDRFSCWMIADPQDPGVYYGFPYLRQEEFGGPTGLKLAHHYPGIETDADRVDRGITQADKEKLEGFLDRYLPGVTESIVTAKVCLYTSTPDENFIIDCLPGYDKRVVIACGFSGHGFKFVPVVGEILADLAEKGKTEWPAGFLGLGRWRTG
jgi:sarcosine oxidase